MASITSEDESSEDNLSFSSPKSNFSIVSDEITSEKPITNSNSTVFSKKPPNLATNILNRQLYGRFARTSKSKTEKVFKNVQHKCRYSLTSLIKDFDALGHIYMGFTLCGQYFLSYTEKVYEMPSRDQYSMYLFNTPYEYELYIWRFVPGYQLKFISKHKIFSHLKGDYVLDKIMFMQFPNDIHKVVCYGYDESHHPDLFHVSIVTLPSPASCIHCHESFPFNPGCMHQSWCMKHGFIIHYMFSMTQPAPAFNPNISLGFPDHLVVNTGHHIHILNVSTLDPTKANVTLTNFIKEEELNGKTSIPANFFNDTFSEVSESASDHFGCSSVVDAILEDFSEYDLESSEGNKPFHELNISCEPLNVTGKSYHNTLVQNIFDPRIKRLQNSSKEYVFSVPQTSVPQSQKPPEKSKIDKKIAEKAYEFIEENEKYEKISLFRKKRLADKKYEFSEDNTENIVPFHILRRERRYLYRSQGRSIKSPEFNSLFLSPRSSGWRSPMQSPNSRCGQFSPSGARHIYCTSVRNSPHHSKSPISPKEAARKVNVYSPSLDSDCSDSDSRLVLKTPINFATSNYNVDSRFNQNGLLIVDPKIETPKWIKKVVRRYSNGDFENSSLLSGQSRDDYNNPIEIPLLVQSLTDQQFDIVPECKMDHLTDRQIIVTQRSMDCEQFVQKRAQILCTEANLAFMYCEDYDIKIIYVCPLNENYWARFLFTWNITTDAFDVIDPETRDKLFLAKEQLNTPNVKFPKFTCNKVWVLSYDTSQTSKSYLRDSNNYFEICLGSQNMYPTRLFTPFDNFASDSDTE
ncbi:hypothetical protein GWI33_001691 [Rhynchophorus ferrugineus]|uniref:DDB1- and CUL4-associated factor 15 WD40 repeat-containing domain-containing protein n=1 Tax=Rhynchophorus ferrugineus TaxID=354439 RepID=A0A834IXN8_RHYFE|nr:hypothetical protein GWI33_001691 [Rhynchophorus ferrugineus]